MLYGKGTEPFHGVFVVKIRGAFTLVQLRKALGGVQAKHPLLGAGIREDARGVPYFIFGKETVPFIPVRIAGRRSDSDWMEETKTEWAKPFDLTNGPLLRIVWLRKAVLLPARGGEPGLSPETDPGQNEVSDLIMTFHHCICDGGSASAILSDLLSLLDKPGLIIGERPAFHSLKDLIPPAVFYRKINLIRARANSVLLGLGLAVVSVFIRTKNRPKIARGNDYILNWKLTEEDSESLFKRCKTAGVTVNTVLSLAILSAFQQVKGKFQHVKGKGFYNKMMCPVDIRKFVPAIKKDTLFAFGLSVTLSLDRRWPGKDFWQLSKELQRESEKKMAKLNAYPVLMAMEYSHSSLNALIRLLTFGKVGNDCMFSNMGRLDLPECCGNLSIETVYSPTVIGPFANPTTIITSTFRNRLDFSFVSNEQYMEYKDAEAIKEKTMEMLQEQVLNEDR